MKKLLTYVMVMLTLVMGVMTVAAPAYADDNGDSCGGDGSTFFSLKPWYAGLLDGNCEIQAPSDDGTGKGIAEFVWGIVLNILYDLSVIVGYLTIIMVAWGGYLYMFSKGMPDRAEKGKSTLIAAIIGLAIAMLASVILNTLSVILIG